MTKRKRTKGQTTIFKHTHTTKDRVTQTPLKTEGEGLAVAAPIVARVVLI